MAERTQSNDPVVAHLDLVKARKFLNRLAEDPFICVVVTDGDIHIYSKDIEAEHLGRVKEEIRKIQKESEGV